ncbi:RpiB/LacA/LacB family sugar-phosphate isomerase, partial [Helicobacter rodentium]
MKFFVASDHAGFTLKAFVVETLEKMGHSVEDLGPKDSNR